MLTQDDFKALSRPFEPSEHEFRKGGGGAMLCYIREDVITPRIAEVDPAFGLTEPMIIDDIDTNISVKIGLTIKGVTRWGIGTSEKKTFTKEPTKSAVTDAYTRAARMFGIGLYLKGLASDESVEDEATLSRWLDGLNQQKLWTADAAQMAWLKNEIITLREIVGDKAVDTTKDDLQVSDFDNARDYFKQLHDKAYFIADESDDAEATDTSNRKTIDFPETTQNGLETFYTNASDIVVTKTWGNARSHVVEGIRIFSREPFEALGFDKALLENEGIHELPSKVIIVWCNAVSKKDKKEFRKGLRMKRVDTGEIVNLETFELIEPAKASGQ